MPTPRSLILAGPVARLPVWLDHLAETWARLSGRTRQLITVLLIICSVLWVVRPRPHPWGPSVMVVSTIHDIQAGATLVPADLVLSQYPASLVPQGHLSDIAQAVGRAATGPLAKGMVLHASSLTDTSPALRAPAGWVAVPVPSDLLVELTPSAVIDLHGGDGNSVLGAIVLEVRGEHVWLAMPRDQAPRLAAALAWGDLHVAVWSDAASTAGT